jgi:hypothetical protein
MSRRPLWVVPLHFRLSGGLLAIWTLTAQIEVISARMGP